jgi:excisionase family DNA binding protein
VSAEPAPHGEAGRLLTAQDVADRWQVPTTQVYRLIREGRLPAVAIGRYRRCRLEAIEAFEQGGGVDA